MDEGRLYLTTREVANRFGVTSQSVLEYIEKGLLKAEKNRGRYYIRPDEADRFMRENCTIRLIPKSAGYYPPSNEGGKSNDKTEGR